MSWDKMTIDDYADFEKANGARLVKRDGIWWREVRPFFYRPFFPFEKIVPGSVKPPLPSCLVGYQHLVPQINMANSYMNFIVFDEIHTYSIDNLARDYRKNIKKGLKNLVVRPVDNLNEFMDDGYRAYTSFYQRTHYGWKKDRSDQNVFFKWAQGLFQFPKLLILGAYYKSDLSAIGISYLVNDIIIYGTFFSNTECLNLRVSELMLHSIREKASECKDAKYIYMGSVKSKKSLNEFKLHRGAKVITEHAYFKINPLMLYLTRQFRRQDYIKLVGLNQEELESYRKNN